MPAFLYLATQLSFKVNLESDKSQMPVSLSGAVCCQDYIPFFLNYYSEAFF